MKKVNLQDYKKYKEFKKRLHNEKCSFESYLEVRDIFKNTFLHTDSEYLKIRNIRKVLYKEFRKALTFKKSKSIKIGKEEIEYIRETEKETEIKNFEVNTFVYDYKDYSLDDTKDNNRRLLYDSIDAISEKIFKKYNNNKK